MRCPIPWAINSLFSSPSNNYNQILRMTFSTSTKIVGARNSLNFRMYFLDQQNKPLSPFHDIPLTAQSTTGADFNMVVEIPRFSNAKLEICKELPANPIKQDVKKGQLRYVKNLFPYHGYPWNYGAIPQTWEWPEHVDPHTGAKGDNDPIDVIEIGSKLHATGDVIGVKVLGVMALLDEGETDWKVLAIDSTDPLASELNGLEDIERLMPGLLDTTRRWFCCYKVPDGKPENQFAFNGECKGRQFALDIIQESHGFWQKLKKGEVDAHGIQLSNEVGSESLTAEEPALPIDPSIHVFHYYKK